MAQRFHFDLSEFILHHERHENIRFVSQTSEMEKKCGFGLGQGWTWVGHGLDYKMAYISLNQNIIHWVGL